METGGVTHILDDVWKNLAGSHPRGEELAARPALPETTQRLLAGIDVDGLRHLLIPLNDSDDDIFDTQSRGISVTTRELRIRGSSTRRYIDIACYDAVGHVAFDLIGGEIGTELDTGGSSAAEVVHRVISKWRRFWGQIPTDILSEEEMLGLFAEIWFLRHWLLPRLPAIEAATCWRGPFGSRHDFEWKGKSVEVKATTSTRGKIHVVHGIDQLKSPDEGELFFFSMRLREEQGAGNDLPSLIDGCRKDLENDSEALTLFENATALARYSPVHNIEYAKLHFRVVEEALFAVKSTFPRIIDTSFPSGLPQGVEKIDYEINLEGFSELVIASSPTELQIL